MEPKKKLSIGDVLTEEELIVLFRVLSLYDMNEGKKPEAFDSLMEKVTKAYVEET